MCPPEWGHFWPQEHNLNKLDGGPLDEASYQISRLVVSDKNIFSCFPYISLCKICDPRGVAIFGPRSIIGKNLAEVH